MRHKWLRHMEGAAKRVMLETEKRERSRERERESSGNELGDTVNKTKSSAFASKLVH